MSVAESGIMSRFGVSTLHHTYKDIPSYLELSTSVLVDPKSVKKKAGRKSLRPAPPRDAVGSKIKELREKRGYSLDQLARLVNSTNQSLSNIETGKSNPEDRRTQRTIRLLSIALKDDFGLEWLKGYKQEIPESNVTSIARPAANLSKVAEISWQVEIPFSGAVAAGKPIEVYLEGETIFVPDWMVIRGKGNFALRVQGDSMIDDHVLDQDLLVVHQVDPATVRSASRMVVDLEDEGATFKIWTRRIQDHVTLTPSNKNLRERTVHVSKIRGVYRPTGLLRKP